MVGDVFADSVCGNGVCEPPLEYPAVGRFGCAADCGLHPNRTSLRIDVAPAWAAGLPGLPGGLPDAAVAGEPAIRFAYNVYSETLGGYLLAADATQPSVTLDVPDGNLRLELYQVACVRRRAFRRRFLAPFCAPLRLEPRLAGARVAP